MYMRNVFTNACRLNYSHSTMAISALCVRVTTAHKQKSTSRIRVQGASIMESMVSGSRNPLMNMCQLHVSETGSQQGLEQLAQSSFMLLLETLRITVLIIHSQGGHRLQRQSICIDAQVYLFQNSPLFGAKMANTANSIPPYRKPPFLQFSLFFPLVKK